MRNRMSALLAIAILLFVFAAPGKATLIGSSVDGSLTFGGSPSNYFDPGYGFIPGGNYLNASGTTVPISANAIEFGFDDGASRIGADFSAKGLAITDLIEISGPTNGLQMVFTDAAFTGQYLIPISDSFPLSSYSIAGDVLTLKYAGGNATAGQTLSASFVLAAVPEPSTAGTLVIAACAALFVFCIRSGRRLPWSRTAKISATAMWSGNVIRSPNR